MNLIEYAKSELSRINDGCPEQELVTKDILQIVDVFSKQGHSGFSANYVLNILERLLRLKPITPLTGADDEWFFVDSDGCQQNVRCGSVFKEPDGTIIDVDAFTVSDNGGITWFYSGKFNKKITMPYLPPIRPEQVYIEYTEDVPPGYVGDEYEIITDKPERIKALHDRKRKEFDEGEQG